MQACSPMYLSIASNSACGGAPMPSSILTKPMNRGIARSSIIGVHRSSVADSTSTSNSIPRLRHRPRNFVSARTQ